MGKSECQIDKFLLKGSPFVRMIFVRLYRLSGMPGVTVNHNYGQSKTTAWGTTYSTRMGWYPFDPRWSLVGEVFGTTGEAEAIPEYKIGLRWEPSQYAVFALSYGQEFKGSNGAGFEVSIMLFSP